MFDEDTTKSYQVLGPIKGHTKVLSSPLPNPYLLDKEEESNELISNKANPEEKKTTNN